MELFKKNELFLLEEIVRKNFASKYKDSVLGIFWSVLKPLLIMVILTIVFSTLFKGSVDNYPVYLLAGRCIYDFFSGSIGLSMNAISNNKNILKRTPAPKYIFILGSMISEFFNFIIGLVILLGVMIVTNTPFYLNVMIFSVIPIFFAFIMFTGISLMLSIIRVYYTDVYHLWGVVTMFMTYASAIFYPMDIIPEPFHRYMILNPLYWIIDQFRCFIYQGVFPSLIYIVNLVLLSLIIFIIGVIIFKKYEKSVAMKF